MTNAELTEHNRKRRIYQIAFLVNDLEGAMKKWVELLQVGPWLVVEMNEKICKGVIEQGRPSTAPFRFHCATAMLGDIQIELIKHDFGVAAYEQWQARHGEGLHHIKEMIPDDRIDQVTAEFAEWGMPLIRAGHFLEDDHRYPDTIPLLGFQLELGNCVEVKSLTPDMYYIYPPEKEK